MSTVQQPHDDPVESTSWVQVLLLEVSKRITEELEIYTLGSMLGVQEYTIKCLLRDYRSINEASYQVLLHWRRKGIDKKKEWPVLKKQLKNALCSKFLGMNQTAAELEDLFQKSDEEQHCDEPDNPGCQDQTLILYFIFALSQLILQV